jgi:pimeloyl-ACP methyl ester carboxylesterase
VSRPEAVTIDDGDLRFDATVAGPERGPVVVLLHGFPQTRRCWRHQIPALADAGYRVVAPDQRGYAPGARPPGVAAYGIHHLVGDVLAFIDWTGADEAHVVGHDWGATVAWQLAGRHGDRLLSVTPISVPHPLAYTAALHDPGADQRDRSWYFDWFAEAGAAEQLLADDAARLRAVYTATGLGEADADAYVAELGTPEALNAALNWYRASGVELLDGLGAVTVPTMHIWSTEDMALGPEGARATGDFVDGPYRLEVLDGVGHWIPELAADRCSELLLDHLAGSS